MSYSVSVRARAQKDLRGLSRPDQERIVRAIDELAGDPRPRQSKKLKGTEDSWRLRVGDFRVIYAIDDHAKTVDVRRVADRKEAYR